MPNWEKVEFFSREVNGLLEVYCRSELVVKTTEINCKVVKEIDRLRWPGG